MAKRDYNVFAYEITYIISLLAIAIFGHVIGTRLTNLIFGLGNIYLVDKIGQELQWSKLTRITVIIPLSLSYGLIALNGLALSDLFPSLKPNFNILPAYLAILALVYARDARKIYHSSSFSRHWRLANF